jgi:hypothetical protein
MASTSLKCSSCKKTFFSSGFSHLCPDCKREKINYDRKSQLQENQQRHEESLMERELEQQRRIAEENRQNALELFNRQKHLEETKIKEKRDLHNELILEQELGAIKNKIYTLASSANEEETVKRLIKLLLHQHDQLDEYIYDSVIALGPPFENIIKEIITQRIMDEIERSFPRSTYSFQRKSVKYFMPYFSGYEFDIFSEFLLNREAFTHAINEEIEEVNINLASFTENKIREINQVKESISEYTSVIEADTIENLASKRKIENSKRVFGEHLSVIPKINMFFLLLYFAYIYFYQSSFEWIVFSIIMAMGYILTYAIVSNNNSNERHAEQVDAVINQNENTLETLINQKEGLEELLKEHQDEQSYLSKELTDFLSTFLN